MQQQTVLILGARGRFGLAVARAFAQAGWRVLGQLRPGATAPVQAQVQWLDLALQDTDALAHAARGAAVVVHALSPAYTRKAWDRQVLPMMDAAIALARALGATLMLPGNVYNFGAAMPAVLREDTPQAARTHKGRLRMRMEQQLAASGVPGIVIRAGNFFGAGRGNWFDLVMARELRQGKFTYPTSNEVPVAWAYLPDLARSFVAVAQKRDQLGRFEVFHFAGHTLARQDWLAVLTPLAREQGWIRASARLKLGAFPLPLLRLGALFSPVWRSLLEMWYLWRTPHRLANDRLTALIGQEPHTPLAQALARALADLEMLEWPDHAASRMERAG